MAKPKAQSDILHITSYRLHLINVIQCSNIIAQICTDYSDIQSSPHPYDALKKCFSLLNCNYDKNRSLPLTPCHKIFSADLGSDRYQNVRFHGVQLWQSADLGSDRYSFLSKILKDYVTAHTHKIV